MSARGYDTRRQEKMAVKPRLPLVCRAIQGRSPAEIFVSRRSPTTPAAETAAALPDATMAVASMAGVKRRSMKPLDSIVMVRQIERTGDCSTRRNSEARS
jgi:hypothetical protein